MIVDRPYHENDALFQKARVNIERTFATGSLFYDDGNEGAELFDGMLGCGHGELLLGAIQISGSDEDGKGAEKAL
jgi:hypothetical protein